MKIRKKWLNQLKTKYFKEYFMHLFAGESDKVVKITVNLAVNASLGWLIILVA
jgi:hypothetical protein